MKKSKTFKLSEQSISCIDELSSVYGVSATEVVEKAVQGLHVMIVLASNQHDYHYVCKTVLEDLLHIHVSEIVE